jgi:hypothetical protein
MQTIKINNPINANKMVEQSMDAHNGESQIAKPTLAATSPMLQLWAIVKPTKQTNKLKC